MRTEIQEDRVIPFFDEVTACIMDSGLSLSP